MTRYVIRRVLYMVPTLFVISIVAFLVIHLPEGDYLSTVKAQLEADGQIADAGQLKALEDRYGLDDSVWVQYLKWIGGILGHGDFGQSFEWNRSVSSLLTDRLPLTAGIAAATLLMSWIVALPVGIYSAVRKYSIGDYSLTFLSFIGLAVPNFLLAMLFAYVEFRYFGRSVGGTFSPEYLNAGWNLGKVIDLFQHMWIPIVVLGTAGTAGVIRILRANLLDELRKPYVVTARAKGISEPRLVMKYPVRVALNPFVSTIGWVLPALVGGEVVVSQVLGMETTGPLLLRALQSQDTYLAGSLVLVLSGLTLIGTLISDILLGLLDARIRFRYE